MFFGEMSLAGDTMTLLFAVPPSERSGFVESLKLQWYNITDILPIPNSFSD